MSFYSPSPPSLKSKKLRSLPGSESKSSPLVLKSATRSCYPIVLRGGIEMHLNMPCGTATSSWCTRRRSLIQGWVRTGRLQDLFRADDSRAVAAAAHYVSAESSSVNDSNQQARTEPVNRESGRHKSGAQTIAAREGDVSMSYSQSEVSLRTYQGVYYHRQHRSQYPDPDPINACDLITRNYHEGSFSIFTTASHSS